MLRTIFVGCDFAKSLDLQQIVVQSDSKENISCLLNDISSGSWEVFSTLTRILRLRDVFQTCRWSWVPRSTNMAANRLASRSNMKICGSSWVNQPPSSLMHVLNKDDLPCPP